jgi:carbonic anhydrase
MEKLLAGVATFQSRVFPEGEALFASLAHGQSPRALFITCSDSRVLPNLITQTEPGELFILRAMGGIVPAHGAGGGVSATIEYAAAVLRVAHIIVCSHSDCGVLGLLADPSKMADLPSVQEWLVHAEAARRIVVDNHPELDAEAQAELLPRYHVAAQLANLRTHPAVASRLAAGDLQVHGWHYDIAHGEVGILDEREGTFHPALEEAEALGVIVPAGDEPEPPASVAAARPFAR